VTSPELPTDFTTARTRFLTAAEEAGAHVRHLEHPLPGPQGDPLATDVARLGNPDAPARLLVVSGTHGVEGFAGSACQEAMLAGGIPAAAAFEAGDLAVVLVHAINPYGFAWVRRVNEDNVDLNRNCVDFRRPLPENTGYDELADALVPDRWDEATQERTAGILLGYAEEHGFDALQAAVSMGQYKHPNGVYFGGTRPVWSRRALEEIARHDCAGAARVALLDLHTGLGPRGVGELIAAHPDARDKQRISDWYGEYTIPSEGTSVSADLYGDILDGFDAWLPDVELTAVTIEYGTVDIIEVANALRADAWLHAFSDPTGPDAAPIKADLRAAFAPDDSEWLAAVRERFDEVSGRAVEGLLQ
jgi:hypothetical protein